MPRSWSSKFIIGDSVYVNRSQVAPSLAKDLFWRVFIDRAIVREVSKDKTRARIEFPFGKSYWFDMNALEYKTNPRPTPSKPRQNARHASSNPPTGGYLGNTHAVVYKRFPGHHCDAKCKAAGHLYIHRFPKNQKTPLTFAKDKKTLKIG